MARGFANRPFGEGVTEEIADDDLIAQLQSVTNDYWGTEPKVYVPRIKALCNKAAARLKELKAKP